jgi:hypothetical protein
MEKFIFEAPDYIDYIWLMHALREYASPRTKVTTLLKKGELIRIKKGLYIAGPAYQKNWSYGVLANRIYGPSYISFEYALSWYRFIPERVENPTSATIKKNAQFSSPVGAFIYAKIPLAAYHSGVDIAQDAGAHFLIATPEKALADTVAKINDLDSPAAVEKYLTNSMRIEYSDLQKLNRKKMSSISTAYANRSVTCLGELLDTLGSNSHE